MPPDLTTQIAVVTGAGRGIGRAICLSLAQAGARVVASARTLAEIQAVADEITAAGGQAHAVPLDVADEASGRALFATVGERWGRLDILVNNAGVGRYGAVADFPLDDLDHLIRVNLRGTFLCCQEAMRMMVPAGRGAIINISSVVGFKGYPRQAAYTATKHAVMGLTKSLAVEAQANGIRVSAVLPGGVDTDLVRQARPDLDPAILLQPEDVAQTVLFLLSLSDRAAVDQVYIRRWASQPF